MIRIEGREGGGQMLRTALALSVLTGKAFRMEQIRANRPKPGLKQQHFSLIKAIADACDGEYHCDGVGSHSLSFTPGTLKGKTLSLDIGTAGSISLLLQGLMVPMLFSPHRHRVEVTGGTDVRWSPPIDFLSHVIVPALANIADVSLSVRRRGYYPKGGGQVDMRIGEDKQIDAPIRREKRGEVVSVRGIAHASKHLAEDSVAERIAKRARMKLSSLGVPVSLHTEYAETSSKGASVVLWAVALPHEDADPLYIGADALGERGKGAEVVAEDACDTLFERIGTDAACDTHLADHLIPYMAVLGGSITTDRISNHIKTNISVCESFLNTEFSVEGNTITAWTA